MLQNFEEKKQPRPEFPNPQFKRKNWLNLNGEWEYSTDRALSGKERKLYNAKELPERIIVPFCRESVLSGIGDTDFCEGCWYLKKIIITDNDLNGNIILNIGACDYKSEVWVNGKYVGSHIGGYVSFSFDITSALKAGENIIVIGVTDKLRDGTQPGGKQCRRYASSGCSYTRTTGIWQTVWLEFVPTAYISSFKLTTDAPNKKLSLNIECKNASGLDICATAFYNGETVGRACGTVAGKAATLEIYLKELHLWEIGDGRLYDLELQLGDDTIESYFGMRSIDCVDGALVMNKKKVFQRLVLDQGFYPDGIYTAPDEASLVADIERSIAMGFNGARLHQKIFEPLFLYHCDRLGYIVWEEHGNWGLDLSRPEAWQGFIPEWTEAVRRDVNHPSIIGWCPLNETQQNQNPEFVKFLAFITRTLDNSRLYIDASGWTHIDGISDILDIHCYEQDPQKFADKLAPLLKDESIDVHNKFMCKPTFVSEYGGIRWASAEAGWGYGEAPKTEQEFIDRFTSLTEVLLKNQKITALCYTQLTDVEQEVNGLYTYDRQAKFNPSVIKAALDTKAAIEE